MIFKTLQKQKIPYAVICGKFYMGEGVDFSTNDWFMIVNSKDRKKVAGLFFHSGGASGILEHTLNTHELTAFKNDLDSYVRVLSNKHGQVYELKAMPFPKSVKPLKKRKK